MGRTDSRSGTRRTTGRNVNRYDSRQRENRRRRRRRRRNRQVGCLSVILVILFAATAGIFYIKTNKSDEQRVAEYAAKNYQNLGTESLKAENLCVASGNVKLEGTPDTNGFFSAGLFDVDGNTVDYAYELHKKVYPASTTKVLTALIAIEQGNLEDEVTVSKAAAASSFAADESVSGIKEGDKLTLKDLLHGLILQSGNDAAVAIAEHISGSETEFAKLMNQRAAELMATESHFVNSNGLHNEDHYTTAYDLYLIFNECIKHQEFIDIINSEKYVANVTGADGTARDIEMEPTNFYALGDAKEPENVTLIGGKTGTTQAAGNCLIFMEKDKNDRPYISIVMGASTKELLYEDMTAIIEAIPGEAENSNS